MVYGFYYIKLNELWIIYSLFLVIKNFFFVLISCWYVFLMVDYEVIKFKLGKYKYIINN